MAATVSINGDEEPWTPPPLLLPVGDGVDPMDLLPFIGKEGNALYLMGNTRVEFPSDLYPPSWDERFVLQNAITEAGKASKRKLSLFNKPGVLVWTTCLESHVTRTGQKHTGTELPRSVPWQMPTTDTMKASNATALPTRTFVTILQNFPAVAERAMRCE